MVNQHTKIIFWTGKLSVFVHIYEADCIPIASIYSRFLPFTEQQSANGFNLSGTIELWTLYKKYVHIFDAQEHDQVKHAVKFQ